MMVELHNVTSIRKTAYQGELRVYCNATIGDEPEDIVHTWKATDTHGVLSGLITEWMEAHPNFPITDYVPPTTEEVRNNMPALTSRQLRLGLVTAGISLDQVTTTIAAMPAGIDRDKALIEWEFAQTFNRNHPLLLNVGSALGLSAAQIDTMWAAALLY